MERVGEHFVPAGPLAVRWLAYELEPVRAGALSVAHVELENAGAVAWRHAAGEQIVLSYHWLDELRNPIVWNGLWRPFGREIPPRERVEVDVLVRAPLPPGRYRLAFDLLDESRCWFAEVGSVPLELGVDVAPRIARALAVISTERDPDTERALAGQDEPLVEPGDAAAIAYVAPGCAPAGDWSRRILDAHQEGYAAVGSAVQAPGRGLRRELAPWAPGGGRNPAFAQPLLCPSLVVGVGPSWRAEVAGLPTIDPPDDEPWVHDGRAVVTAPRRSGRRRA